MILRKNKIYDYSQMHEAVCRKCGKLVPWDLCDCSNAVIRLDAECCREQHHIEFTYNESFELKGKYHRERCSSIQSKS